MCPPGEPPSSGSSAADPPLIDVPGAKRRGGGEKRGVGKGKGGGSSPSHPGWPARSSVFTLLDAFLSSLSEEGLQAVAESPALPDALIGLLKDEHTRPVGLRSLLVLMKVTHGRARRTAVRGALPGHRAWLLYPHSGHGQRVPIKLNDSCFFLSYLSAVRVLSSNAPASTS